MIKQAAYLFLLIYMAACQSASHTEQGNKQDTGPDPLIRINRKLVENKQEEINSWVKRHGYTASKTGSGLQYIVLHKGTGNRASKGMFARVNYKVSLVDGTLCYDTHESGPQEILIEQDNAESGIHEGLQLMSVGDKYLLLLPPHLAHGLLGDSKKIPPLSVLIYEVELLSIHDKK